MSLITLLWRLTTLQCRAEQVPHSIILLTLSFLLNASVTSLGLSGSGMPNDLALKVAIISLIASGLSLYGLLRYKKLQARFVQLWSAILAVDMLCTFASVLLYQLLGANVVQALLGLLLGTWSWWVGVQFLMQAFNTKVFPAIGVSFAMQIAAVLGLFLFLPELSQFLFQAPS